MVFDPNVETEILSERDKVYKYKGSYKMVSRMFSWSPSLRFSPEGLGTELRRVSDEYAFEDPIVRLSTDADGRPYIYIEGWVEMTLEDLEKRGELRSMKKKKQMDAQREEHLALTEKRKKHAENCPFCRRG